MTLPTTLVHGKKYFRIEGKTLKEDLLKLLPKNIKVNYFTQHWTAAPYNQGYPDYQILIGDTYILVSANIGDWTGHQHTWRRNTNNIGLSYMAMWNATERNYGKAPVTKGMLERMSASLAVLLKVYNLSPDKIKDHAFWAEVDGYKGQRWDNRSLSPSGNKQTLFTDSVNKSKWYLKNFFG